MSLGKKLDEKNEEVTWLISSQALRAGEDLTVKSRSRGAPVSR